jgi:hypothetical protein
MFGTGSDFFWDQTVIADTRSVLAFSVSRGIWAVLEDSLRFM